MAKAFFRQNPTTLVWEYGTFKADGITPDVELTINAARARWETVNEAVCLTLRHVDDDGEFHPFRSIPIIYVASDLIGTPYANRAAFEDANKDFFFRVGGSGVSADGFLYLPTTISNKGIRIGERTGWVYSIDAALTITGFNGDENTDWENIGGVEIV
jgi:hypothetical protein